LIIANVASYIAENKFPVLVLGNCVQTIEVERIS
jgi:hypothetical protein